MRTINLNKEYLNNLTNEIRTNKNLNDNDKTIASYLLHIEKIRINSKDNDKDYIYPSYSAISNATNVKARQTINKSISRLLDEGVILKLVKGSVKDGANRYWMNPKYLNQEVNSKPVIEYRSMENNDNSQIYRLLVEIQSEVKSLRKENQELKEEIREMKEMMLEKQSIVDDDVLEMEEPQVEIAIETPSSPSNVEYRSIETLKAKEKDKEISDKVDSIFNSLRPKLRLDDEDEYEKELGEVLDMMANGKKEEPVIEPIEQSTITIPTPTTTNKPFSEREKELDEKYKSFSYLYEKPFSKLYSEKEIMNEIEFRNSVNKPIYDLQERLTEIRGIA